MSEDILDKIKDLPQAVQDYLFSSDLAKRTAALVAKYKLVDKRLDLFDILNQLFAKDVNVATLPSLILSKLKIKDDKIIKALAGDIIQNILMPVKDYFGAELGGEATKSEQDILIDKAIKKFNLFTAALAVIPAKAGIPSAGGEIPHQVRDDAENLKKKFSEIAGTFLNNARTKVQFKNTLVKPAADGGLGMEHEMADDVAEFLASYMRLRSVIPDAERKRSNYSGIQKNNLDSRLRGNDRKNGGNDTKKEMQNDKTKLVPPNVKIEVTFEKEEKEAAGKKPKIEKMKIAAPKLLSVTEGVQKALAELNYTFPSSELQERLKSVIDARVRNVRTSVQTFEKLTQDIPSGGMGFPKAEADQVSLVLNKYLEEKNKDIYGSKLAEIKQAEDEEKRKSEERARLAEEAEQKKLNEKFTKLTGKEIPLNSPFEKGEKKGDLILPPALTKKEIEGKKTAVIPDAERKRGNYSGIQKKDDWIPASAGMTEKKAEMTGKELPMIIPKKSVIAMTPPPRPVVEDIKFTPKLAGPVEEIMRLTLEDFRKLSHDPKEAILKIKDKLQLLRDESYKKYQAGLLAWQKSPLYGEYLKAIGQSLTAGAPLHDILKGGQTLTESEFDAIIHSSLDS